MEYAPIAVPIGKDKIFRHPKMSAAVSAQPLLFNNPKPVITDGTEMKHIISHGKNFRISKTNSKMRASSTETSFRIKPSMAEDKKDKNMRIRICSAAVTM